MVKDNSLSSKILDIVIYVSLILLVIVTLYPIIYILSVSLSSKTAYEAGKVVLFPVDFNLGAYKVVFQAGTVPRAFVNSVIYTVTYTVLSLLFTTSMAYPLSRAKERVPFKVFFSKLVVLTMFFSAGIVPNYSAELTTVMLVKWPNAQSGAYGTEIQTKANTATSATEFWQILTLDELFKVLLNE